MEGIDPILDYTAAIANWLVDQSDEYLCQGEVESALRYMQIAGRILSTQNRDLASPRIEKNLQLSASLLADAGLIRRNSPVRTEFPERCLHILNEALPAGGLTAMARRWIQNDTDERIHSVVLLSQEVPVPLSLRRAVKQSGGLIHTPSPDQSLTQRAIWLRSLVEEQANHVILHIELADVVCGVAFGVAGGPCVLLVNHAAHLYWSGASIPDLVVNCRGSQKEVDWSSIYRGVGAKRCATVPIPLDKPSLDLQKQNAKREFCRRLNISPDSILVITVGAAFKFMPTSQLDFVKTWEELLDINRNAVLIAVGFVGNERWNDASARMQGRITTLGAIPHAELLRIFGLADLYTEAFPFGTTTSLLEAGFHGLPVCLAPAQAPPPYASDGVALDDILVRPATVEAYKENITRLCRDSLARSKLGRLLQRSIGEHHTGDGWRRYLADALRSLPDQHTPLSIVTPQRTPSSDHELWTQFSSNWDVGYETSIETALRRLYEARQTPRLTGNIRNDLARFRCLRSGNGIPAALLIFFVNVVMPRVPMHMRARAFGAVAFLFRGSLRNRLMQKIKVLTGMTAAPLSPYHEYVTMREEEGVATCKQAAK